MKTGDTAKGIGNQKRFGKTIAGYNSQISHRDARPVESDRIARNNRSNKKPPGLDNCFAIAKDVIVD
jgi:hypothetical protein